MTTNKIQYELQGAILFIYFDETEKQINNILFILHIKSFTKKSFY
jgi:hypothetical protein